MTYGLLAKSCQTSDFSICNLFLPRIQPECELNSAGYVIIILSIICIIIGSSILNYKIYKRKNKIGKLEMQVLYNYYIIYLITQFFLSVISYDSQLSFVS